MASLIPGFEYDIFISYRQKDEREKGRKGEGEIETVTGCSHADLI